MEAWAASRQHLPRVGVAPCGWIARLRRSRRSSRSASSPAGEGSTSTRPTTTGPGGGGAAEMDPAEINRASSPRLPHSASWRSWVTQTTQPSTSAADRAGSGLADGRSDAQHGRADFGVEPAGGPAAAGRLADRPDPGHPPAGAGGHSRPDATDGVRDRRTNAPPPASVPPR